MKVYDVVARIILVLGILAILNAHQQNAASSNTLAAGTGGASCPFPGAGLRDGDRCLVSEVRGPLNGASSPNSVVFTFSANQGGLDGIQIDRSEVALDTSLPPGVLEYHNLRRVNYHPRDAKEAAFLSEKR